MKGSIRISLVMVLGIIMCVCAGTFLAQAQTTIYSNGTGGGNWDSTATWQGGVVPPDSTTNVVIVSGDSVNIRSTILTSIKVNDLTIQSNAKLANSFSTAGVTLTCKGAFTIASSGWYYGNSASVQTWPEAASFSIDNASNYVQTVSGSSTIGQAGRATFGNLINAKTGTGSVAGADLVINGDLIIRTGATGTTFRGTNNTQGVNRSHHVLGNVILISGQWAAVDAPIDGLTCVWNIDGNVTAGDPSAPNLARIGPFASADGGFSRLGVFNIGGNLTVRNGARLQAGSSTSSTATTEKGIINIKGNFTTDATAIYATNSKGTLSVNFTGTGTQTISLGAPLRFSSTTNPVTVYDTVASGSSIVFTGNQSWLAGSSTVGTNGYGAWIVNGSIAFGVSDTIKGYQAFDLNSGATLKTKNVNGIDSVAGSIQATGVKTINAGANLVFDGTTAQVTGLSTATTVNNMTIDNSAGVTTSQAVTVNGTLNLLAGLLEHTANPVTVNGSVNCAGGSSNPDLCTVPCTDISISAGWNLVSIPRVQSDYTATVLFPGLFGSMFEYVPGSGYSPMAVLELGKAYWLYYTTPGIVPICGECPDAITISAKLGWNLIGSTCQPYDLSELIISGGNTIFGGVAYVFIPGTGYSPATTVNPGQGAWMFISGSSSDCTITIPAK